VTVQFLITFTTSFLEDKNLVCLTSVVKYSCLYNSTLYIRSTYLNSALSLYEENLVKNNSSTFFSREAVYEDFIASLYLELLACDVHNCVHSIKTFLSFDCKRLLVCNTYRAPQSYKWTAKIAFFT